MNTPRFMELLAGSKVGIEHSNVTQTKFISHPRTLLAGLRPPCCHADGEKDSDVPLDIAFRTMRALRSADVQLNLLKGGGHRLSEPHEIAAILRTVAALLEPAP